MGKPKKKALAVYFTEEELLEIDRARGPFSRSIWARVILLGHLKKGKAALQEGEHNG